MKSNVNLRANLTEESYNYVVDYFSEFVHHKTGLTCFGRYDDSEWIKFFENGHASYCRESVKDIKKFNSYQDCVNFIMKK